MADQITVQAYLAAVRAALKDVPASDRDDAVRELEANLAADIQRRGGDASALAAAIADLGTPGEYAEAVREALCEDTGVAVPQGRVLGMPYEFRAPTAESVMLRMWNPADPRVIVPRTWGVGWTINFGAIAVRLGLARPDDVEEHPLQNLSPRTLALAVAVPLAIALVSAVAVVAYWDALPRSVPVHFDAAGAPDDWAPKPVAIGLSLLVSTVAPVVVLGYQRIRRTSTGTMAVTSVMLTLLSLLAAIVLGYTIANAVYGVTGWWLGLLILGSLVVPGTMLYALARSSLRHEWRSDSLKG